ncbi:MAG: DNA sulfur modification protein DndB [Chloroflexi bacterium]|nr:DNA sulfur modification protein DndB [Chloroflexota bacterium]
MATYIPAIRARIGVTDYFVSVMTLGEASRMIDYAEDVDGWTSETPPELKMQRKLNVQRVEKEMVPYLVANEDHFYSALTVEVRTAARDRVRGLDFESTAQFPGGIEFGQVTLDGTESLYALDGQHRLKSIEFAIRQRPELAGEHIALILVPFGDIAKSQTLFSDLNRNAKTPSKSISLLFAHRDPHARIAKRVAEECALLHGRMNFESTSLSANARQFMTLSTLYEMTRTLLGDIGQDVEDEDEQRLACDVVAVLDCLTEAIPAWRKVRDDEEHPAYLRQRELAGHGVAQRALADLARRARAQAPAGWQKMLKSLDGYTKEGQPVVDWRLTNPDWQSVALQGGRVNNTSTSIQLLANELAGAIGLEPEKGGLAHARRGAPQAPSAQRRH